MVVVFLGPGVSHLQVQFCADRANFSLRMRVTPQLTRISGFQGPTARRRTSTFSVHDFTDHKFALPDWSRRRYASVRVTHVVGT